MVSRSTLILILVALVIIGIQFIKFERTNPPVTADLQAPSEVKWIFVKSCYDCHSNETKWPWYSKIAPVSWLVVNDVNEGREHLNFSEWEKLYTDKQHDLGQKIIEEIDKDEMAPGLYVMLHPSSSLDLNKKQLIKKWIKENL